MPSALERRLEALEQQTRPRVVGVWDTEDGDVVEVWSQGRHLGTMTVAAFWAQYPDGTLCKIVHSDEAAA